MEKQFTFEASLNESAYGKNHWNVFINLDDLMVGSIHYTEYYKLPGYYISFFRVAPDYDREANLRTVFETSDSAKEFIIKNTNKLIKKYF